jgi:hypothetical protein
MLEIVLRLFASDGLLKKSDAPKSLARTDQRCHHFRQNYNGSIRNDGALRNWLQILTIGIGHHQI